MVFKLLLLLSFSFNLASGACGFKVGAKIVSLSGPITMLIEELGLIKDPGLFAISTLHPIKETLKIKKIAGGLFLSSKTLKSFKDKIVFIDQSRELEQNIRKHKVKKLHVVSTRLDSSIKVVEDNVRLLKKYLSQCDLKIKKLGQYLKSVRKKLDSLQESNRTYLFYLGAISKSKMPPLIMVNDGVVKDLIDNKVKTYPSELAYVSWSEKVINGFSGPVIHFGLVDSKLDKIEKNLITGNEFNLKFRGLLIPGIRQVRFLDQLIEHL